MPIRAARRRKQTPWPTPRTSPQRLTKHLAARVTPEEKETCLAQAEAAGLRLSVWMRHRMGLPPVTDRRGLGGGPATSERYLTIRVNRAEFELCQAHARSEGLTLSSWLRQCCDLEPFYTDPELPWIRVKREPKV